MLAYIAKLACFQPVASSLRSNFPKLVFGHLHLFQTKCDRGLFVCLLLPDGLQDFLILISLLLSNRQRVRQLINSFSLMTLYENKSTSWLFDT